MLGARRKKPEEAFLFRALPGLSLGPSKGQSCSAALPVPSLPSRPPCRRAVSLPMSLLCPPHGCLCPTNPHPTLLPHHRRAFSSLTPCPFPVFTHSTAPQRVPVASPSAHNISSSGGAPERTNFPRGVSSRSTFHAGQLRQVRDQPNLSYGVTPASPSGNSQGRRGASGSIFSKFTSKFVRR